MKASLRLQLTIPLSENNTIVPIIYHCKPSPTNKEHRIPLYQQTMPNIIQERMNSIVPTLTMEIHKLPIKELLRTQCATLELPPPGTSRRKKRLSSPPPSSSIQPINTTTLQTSTKLTTIKMCINYVYRHLCGHVWLIPVPEECNDKKGNKPCQKTYQDLQRCHFCDKCATWRGRKWRKWVAKWVAKWGYDWEKDDELVAQLKRRGVTEKW